MCSTVTCRKWKSSELFLFCNKDIPRGLEIVYYQHDLYYLSDKQTWHDTVINLSYTSWRGSNVQIAMNCICCGAILTLVQFQLFLCFYTHYHTLPYKKQERKCWYWGPDKIVPNVLMIILHKSAYKLKL